MVLWPAYAAAALIVATTATIYAIDVVAMDGAPQWLYLSGLLNRACSDSTAQAAASGIGAFGYSLAITALNEAERRAFWVDGDLLKLVIGLLASLMLYAVLGFPTGRSAGTDAVHHVSLIIGLVLLSTYTVMSVDPGTRPLGVVQNLAALAMIGSGIALLISFVMGELDEMGWNAFVSSEFAYGISFVAFLLSWGTLRSGPNRPPKSPRTKV
jgi:hypothetical protein